MGHIWETVRNPRTVRAEKQRRTQAEKSERIQETAGLGHTMPGWPAVRASPVGIPGRGWGTEGN